jgi:hypothetical protein
MIWQESNIDHHLLLLPTNLPTNHHHSSLSIIMHYTDLPTYLPTYRYDPTDTGMNPLAVGDCLASSIASADYAAGTTIGYMPPSHFFTWPSLAWNGSTVSAAVGGGSYDSFQFSVVTLSSSSSLPSSSSSSSSSVYVYRAISSSTTQYVAVLNKNEPTEVEYGSGNGEDEDDEEEEQITIRPIAFGSDNVAIVSRFTIWDPDCDTDLVRVQVVSERGARMTLNRNHIDALHFISPTYCYGNLRWQCKGSGYYEDEMSFVGRCLSFPFLLAFLAFFSLL